MIVLKFFAWLLITVGTLLLLLCGGCGVIVIAAEPSQILNFLSVFWIPLLIAIGLIILGTCILSIK